MTSIDSVVAVAVLLFVTKVKSDVRWSCFVVHVGSCCWLLVVVDLFILESDH